MRYSLEKEEWRHLYPLKKFLVFGMEVFLIYFLLGFAFVCLTRPGQISEIENLWWVSAFLAVTACFWTPYTIKCVRTRYLCVPMASRYLPKRELKAHLEAETFMEVEGTAGGIKILVPSGRTFYSKESGRQSRD